jgi:hypothetical protein
VKRFLRKTKEGYQMSCEELVFISRGAGYFKNMKEAKKYSRFCQLTPMGVSSQVKKHE